FLFFKPSISFSPPRVLFIFYDLFLFSFILTLLKKYLSYLENGKKGVIFMQHSLESTRLLLLHHPFYLFSSFFTHIYLPFCFFLIFQTLIYPPFCFIFIFRTLI